MTRSSGSLQRDVLTQALKLGDQPADLTLRIAPPVVVATEVAVDLAASEHVPVGDQHRVLDGPQGTAVADPRPQALVLGLQGAALGPGGGKRRLVQGDGEPLRALAAAPRARLAGRAVVARAGAGPGGQVARRGKRLMSGPISATSTSAVRLATPVIVAASSTAAAKGRSCSSIASLKQPICSSRKSRWARMAPMIRAW